MYNLTLLSLMCLDNKHSAQGEQNITVLFNLVNSQTDDGLLMFESCGKVYYDYYQYRLNFPSHYLTAI